MRISGQKIAAVSLGLLLSCCPLAFPLDPSLDVSQYAHTSWKVRDGFAKGEITSIAQTQDGYLWLGTAFGLLRFDGVRNLNWQPPPGQAIPSSVIMSLLAAHDGTLWIGTLNGLASWKNGKLTTYPEFAGRQIFALLEDHTGMVWVTGNAVTTGKLCAIRNGNIQCFGEDGSLGRGAFSLYEDSRGNLWAGVVNGIWRWRPGPPKFYSLPGELNGIHGLGEDSDGTLLIGWKDGIYRFSDGRTGAYPLPGFRQKFRARRLFRDGDGSLWIGTSDQGVLHVHQGRTDVFHQSDGLSGEIVHAVFQDREHNIWVATPNGLDRFRDFAAATLNVNQGLSNDAVSAVLADQDGSVWFSTRRGLDRWNHGEVKAYPIGRGSAGANINDVPQSMFQDSHGRIWISTLRGLGYLADGRFVPLSSLPAGAVLSMAQDRAGNLWIDNEHEGLFRLSPQNEVNKISWAELGHKDHASILAADPSQGGLWMGFFLGGIAYYLDGKIRSSYTTANGLGEGRISSFQFDNDGTTWIGTEGGLSRLKDDHIATLTSKNGLPCDAVNWVMEDDSYSFWLYMPCGLVRISRAEMDAWARDNNKAAPKIQATVFDNSDGVRSVAGSGHFNPQVAKSSDGQLWFLPLDGVSIVDPQHLHSNQLPPPVHIEQVTADEKTYDASNGMRLPSGVRSLAIDYTALSLAAPEKVRFRYKLEGQNRDWHEVVNNREVQYTNLAPGNYRFRVLACNNSGVWNEEGATLEFVIPPAWHQTNWFRAACVLALLALIWGTYRLRVWQLAAQFNMRLDERVHERTRIARELHDTLLQSFHGLLMSFQTAWRLLPERPIDAKEKLGHAIEQAEEAILESREAVQGLRASTMETNDLAKAINTLGEELATDSNNHPAARFQVAVEGVPRDLHPILRDEVYRIAAEALRNAFHHAQAREIEVEIHYDNQQFRLRVRDDGRGFDPAVAHRGREGHYGLPGMKERAKIAGGELTVWSEMGAGTEVELKIPANTAYAKAPRGS